MHTRRPRHALAPPRHTRGWCGGVAVPHGRLCCLAHLCANFHQHGATHTPSSRLSWPSAARLAAAHPFLVLLRQQPPLACQRRCLRLQASRAACRGGQQRLRCACWALHRALLLAARRDAHCRLPAPARLRRLLQAQQQTPACRCRQICWQRCCGTCPWPSGCATRRASAVPGRRRRQRPPQMCAWRPSFDPPQRRRPLSAGWLRTARSSPACASLGAWCKASTSGAWWRACRSGSRGVARLHCCMLHAAGQPHTVHHECQRHACCCHLPTPVAVPRAGWACMAATAAGNLILA